MKKRELILGMAVLASLTAATFMCGCNTANQAMNTPERIQAMGSLTEVQQTQPIPIAQQKVSTFTLAQADAKAVALSDAGLNEADAVFTKLGRDTDNGIEKYEIDFYSGNMKYEYDIDANTGAILSWSQEMFTPALADNGQAAPEVQSAQTAQPAQNTQSVQAAQPTQNTQPAQNTKAAQPAPAQPAQNTQSTQGVISQDKALDIAVAAAGVSKSDVSRVKVKYEFDGDYGKNVYDVEFHIGMTEYSYDIDPVSGGILSYDIDQYDD